MDHQTHPALGKCDTSKKSSSMGAVAERQIEGSKDLHDGVPPSTPDNDNYILEAFGDISLSTIDFVPPPPTTLSPPKGSRQMLSSRPPPSRSGKGRRPTNKPKALSRSRGRANSTEISFSSLVASLKNQREAEDTSAKSPGHITGAPQKQLLDLVNLGSEAAIPEGRSHEGFKNSEMDMICADEHDENIVPGIAKNRKQIPRWS